MHAIVLSKRMYFCMVKPVRTVTVIRLINKYPGFDRRLSAVIGGCLSF
jgi:hypothetical protein